MTTLNQWQMADTTGEMGSTTPLKLTGPMTGRERRQFRRHDMETQGITIYRWDGRGGAKKAVMGRIVDLSAGGIRIRTTQANIRPDQQIRVRLELPDYAGICPFINTRGDQPQPAREWVGWMAVSRVQQVGGGEFDVGGRLVDMEEMDRGMLSLYLSTQPIAA